MPLSLSRRAALVLALSLNVANVAAPRAASAAVGSAGTLSWHRCASSSSDAIGRTLDRAGAQCAELEVPLDHDHPSDGRTISLAISRLPATTPGARHPALAINPGGPGVPALDQVLLGIVEPALRRYDLIGMDPRFVGRSSPITCTWPTGTPLRSAGATASSFAAAASFQRSLADGCRDAAVARLPYATTAATADDLDRVRAALGVPRLSYLGVSYGTMLGAVFLHRHPNRAGRVVLDSAVDPALYGPRLLSQSGPALEGALRHWAARTAARGSSLGRDGAAIVRTVRALQRTASVRPIDLAGQRIDGSILPVLLMGALADDSPQSYATLARDVEALRAGALGGHARRPSVRLREQLADLLTADGPAADRAGQPIICGDRGAPTDPGVYAADIDAHRAAEPLFGPVVRNIGPCAFWPQPTPADAPLDVSSRAPVLMVGADHDPLTPRAGQRAMHRALGGSRLVLQRGAWRHGAFATGSRCIDRAVLAYLGAGRLPRPGAACAAPGRP
ncbi:MAG: alpha/beta hydrolase [Patulibacter minatonensis]